MKKELLRHLIPGLARQEVCEWTQKVADLPIPVQLRPFVIRGAARVLGADLTEADRSPGEFQSLADFFVRRLRPGLRPIEGEPCHPCDGILSGQSLIKEDSVLLVKGQWVNISDLLAERQLPEDLKGGTAYTYYLGPSDYHRVHAPVSGEIRGVRWIPGAVWPVNDWGMSNVPRLFEVNARAVLNISTANGSWRVVMVGALNVSSIECLADGKSRRIVHALRHVSDEAFDRVVELRAGQELGAFRLGSSVVVLAPPSATGFEVQAPRRVRMGQALFS